ncbi:uncharacterized protein LOC132270529 [Cornus florida]|uniref:uncharacterized protein LOC132270529 n=1 Tax=Cornus florida TaxID=4283 RepID=UPI0028A2D762|nr:uncharacterized protein LOC132270529 [Cornus florida]
MGLKKSEANVWYDPKFGVPQNEDQDMVMDEQQGGVAEEGGNGDREEEVEAEEEELEDEEEDEEQHEAPTVHPSEEQSLRALLLESIALSKEQIALGKENREHILEMCERLEEVANEVDLVKRDLADLQITGLPHL